MIRSIRRSRHFRTGFGGIRAEKKLAATGDFGCLDLPKVLSDAARMRDHIGFNDGFGMGQKKLADAHANVRG